MTMSGTVVLYGASRERLQVPIPTTADPTATPPDWSLTAPGATAPGSWTAGSWSGTWTGGGVTVGSEVAVWPVGAIRVP